MGEKTWKLSIFILIASLSAILGHESFENHNPLETTETHQNHEKVVFCYFNRESGYRPALGHFDIKDIDARLCTHLIYAYAKIDENHELVAGDPKMDLSENGGHSGFSRVVDLKKYNPKLKVLLGVGSYKFPSKNFSELAANDSARSHFAKQSAEFLVNHEFDGLDLNWHFPTTRGGIADDKENFVKLCVDIKREYTKHELLLTAPVKASKDAIDFGYDVKNLAGSLDFMVVLTYDMGGSWDKRISPLAPLKVTDGGSKSITFIVDYLIFRGVPAEKLILGLPFHGRTFKTELEGLMGDSAFSEGFEGPYTKRDGFLGYNEICTFLMHPSFNWTSEWDSMGAEMLSRYRDPITNLTHAVVYDTQRSMANKVRFAVQKDLAGVAAWSIDMDDFRAECGYDHEMYADFGKFPGIDLDIPEPPAGKFGLLKAVQQAFGVAKNELNKETAMKKELEEAMNFSKNVVETKDFRSDASSCIAALFTIFPIILVHILTL